VVSTGAKNRPWKKEGAINIKTNAPKTRAAVAFGWEAKYFFIRTKILFKINN